MLTVDDVDKALDAVMDPELPISVRALGLIRGVEVDAGAVHIQLTYTTLGCPCIEIIRSDIINRITELPGVEQVQVEEVFDCWSRRDISAAGLKSLRKHGVT